MNALIFVLSTSITTRHTISDQLSGRTVLHLLLSEGSTKFFFTKVHSCGLFLINIGEGTASLRVAVLPSVVEYLYDELDGVSDLMSPVQPLLTQAVTDDDHSKRNCKNKSSRITKLLMRKVVSDKLTPKLSAQMYHCTTALSSSEVAPIS